MKTSKFQNTAMERYKHIRTFKKPVYNITVQKPYTLKTYKYEKSKIIRVQKNKKDGNYKDKKQYTSINSNQFKFEAIAHRYWNDKSIFRC